MYILYQLGYESNFSRKNEIIITVDAKSAIKEIDKLAFKARELKKELDGL